MPRPCDLDLLTLKAVSESHVTWATSVPILFFLGLPLFTCAAPSIWNALPDYLKDTALSLSNCEKQLKTFLFSRY